MSDGTIQKKPTEKAGTASTGCAGFSWIRKVAVASALQARAEHVHGAVAYHV
jgi:hypothetical protein